MANSLTKTRLYQLREVAIEQAMVSLKGTPAQDKDGSVILVDGKPLMIPPTAAVLTAVLKLLKDNGIDSDPIDVLPGQKAIAFEDEDTAPVLLD